MHNGAKNNHSHYVGHEGGETDDHGELLEKEEISEEKDTSAEEGGGASRADTQSHLSVALLHLVEPGGSQRVHIVRSQMKHVVHCKPDKHHHSNRLVLTELLSVPVHECDDRKDDH